jgi:hypothetical protein
MKSLSWFKRATPFYHVEAPQHDDDAQRSAVAWQTQTTEVHSSFIAVDTPEQLDKNLAAIGATPDMGVLQGYVRKARESEAGED